MSFLSPSIHIKNSKYTLQPSKCSSILEWDGATRREYKHRVLVIQEQIPLQKPKQQQTTICCLSKTKPRYQQPQPRANNHHNTTKTAYTS